MMEQREENEMIDLTDIKKMQAELGAWIEDFQNGLEIDGYVWKLPDEQEQEAASTERTHTSPWRHERHRGWPIYHAAGERHADGHV